MKSFFATLVMFTWMITAVYSQYFYLPFINAGKNPGALNTDFENPVGGGLAGGWTQISLATYTTPAWGPIQTLPFSFLFNGSPVTKFKVSSSGVLTFSFVTAGAAPSYTRAALPDATIPDSSICIWGLSSLGTNDYVVKKIFGTAPHRQLWVQFTSFSYGTVPSDGNNFTYWSIVLEETSNDIFIVDERSGGYAGAQLVSAGIQINSTTAFPIAGSPNLAATANLDNTPSNNTYYQFIQGTRQALDMCVQTQNLAYNIQKNANNTVSGTIFNYGTDTIKSMTMNYSVNKGTSVMDNLSSLSIPPLTTYSYSHSIPWVPAAYGNDTLRIWADNLNGSQDTKHVNDTLSATFMVYDSLFLKKALLEEVTQASCDPCANYNPHLDSARYSLPGIYNLIRYHPSYPGQDFMNQETQPQVSPRAAYYAINAAPTLEFDGLVGYPGGTGIAAATKTLIHKYADVKSPFQIIITNATYTQPTNDINVTANFTAYGNFPADLRAFAVITDSLHFSKNQSTESIPQYAFSDVMVQMLPSTSGQSLAAFTSGQTQTLSFSWTQNRPLSANYANFPYDSSKFSVVVFVQDYNSSRFVWQSEKTTLNMTMVGVKETSAGINYLSIYPNPFSNTASVNFGIKDPQHVVLEIYNMIGSRVYTEDEGQLASGLHTFPISKKNLESGIYFLKITTDNGDITKKLVIQ